MGHVYKLTKQFKVQIIGILDSFYWPKMQLWKGAKNSGQGPPPTPYLDKIEKNSGFFRDVFP